MKTANAIIICLLWIAVSAKSYAQPSVEFKDGLYLSAQEWAANQPSWTDGRVRIKVKRWAGPGQLKIGSVKVRQGAKWRRLPLKKMWGVSYRGVPYILTRINAGEATLHRIHILGSISFFIEERWPNPPLLMGAKQVKKYQDGTVIEESLRNGLPVASPISLLVGLEEPLLVELFFKKLKTKPWIISPREGKLRKFKAEELRVLIADDEELLRHFDNNPDREAHLFLYLQKYNERNPYPFDN